MHPHRVNTRNPVTATRNPVTDTRPLVTDTRPLVTAIRRLPIRHPVTVTRRLVTAIRGPVTIAATRRLVTVLPVAASVPITDWDGLLSFRRNSDRAFTPTTAFSCVWALAEVTREPRSR